MNSGASMADSETNEWDCFYWRETKEEIMHPTVVIKMRSLFVSDV